MTDIRSRWAMLNLLVTRFPEDKDSSADYRSTTIYLRHHEKTGNLHIRIPGLTSAAQVVVYDNLESAIHAVKSLDTLIDWYMTQREPEPRRPLVPVDTYEPPH